MKYYFLMFLLFPFFVYSYMVSAVPCWMMWDDDGIPFIEIGGHFHRFAYLHHDAKLCKCRIYDVDYEYNFILDDVDLDDDG